PAVRGHGMEQRGVAADRVPAPEPAPGRTGESFQNAARANHERAFLQYPGAADFDQLETVRPTTAGRAPLPKHVPRAAALDRQALVRKKHVILPITIDVARSQRRDLVDWQRPQIAALANLAGGIEHHELAARLRDAAQDHDAPAIAIEVGDDGQRSSRR